MMAANTPSSSTTTIQTRRARLLGLYRDTLGPLLRDRAVWCFCAVWAVAAVYLSLVGSAHQVVVSLTFTVPWLVVLGLATILLTANAPVTPPADDAAKGQRGRWWIQLAVVLAFAVLTAQRGMVFHKDAPGAFATIPLWSPLVSLLTTLWGKVLPNPFWGVNPTLYVLLPGICLLALGARWRELGFARGYRSWTVALLWSAVFLVPIVIALISGGLGALLFLKYLVSNLLQNGFSEEFLMRGALMTRLMPLVGRSWAAVLSAIVFGMWHLGLNTQAVGGNYLAGLALGVISQGTFGLAMAIVFLRTRNLLAPTIIHILADVPVG
jgi:membrane protease YdiL (CAAX protease family)